jgi:hypothetical protein
MDFIQWPQGQDIHRVVQRFNEHTQFPNIVGLIDGTHIEIPCQRNDPSFIDRHHTASMHLQAICDYDMVFRDIYFGHAGSMHDANVFSRSPIYSFLKSPNTNLNPNWHILGDSAYPLEEFLMKPYRDNGNLNAVQRNFNISLSSVRVRVENAFGLLRAKWRRLRFIELKNLSNAKYIVISACCLHNYYLTRTPFPEIEAEIRNINREAQVAVEIRNNPGIRAANKRNEIAQRLANIR